MGYTPLHFTEEERIFRDQMYRFADQEIAPIADEIDHNDRFPEEIIPKFSELELLQWSVPRSHGGPEGSLTMLCIAREAIARHSLSLSVMVGENGNGLALPLLFAGSEEQKNKYFPILTKGKTLVAFALSVFQLLDHNKNIHLLYIRYNSLSSFCLHCFDDSVWL